MTAICYTSWGDGGGFGGSNKEGRVSLGFGRVEGGRADYRGVNIAGGKDAPHPSPFTGKTEGLLAIGNTLYCWRNAKGSNNQTFERMELYRSDDRAATWRFTGVAMGKKDGTFPPGDEGFYGPAVCQFGQGNRGARDEYVYVYAPDIVDPSHWDMRRPGRIHLMRVPARSIESQAAYEFFAGTDARGKPRWARAAGERKPVWEDAVNGTHRMAVSYNPGLKRYLLTTVTVSRDGWMSIYDAPEPWGPWTLVHVERNQERWGRLVILYTFVNKWLSKDGRDFVIVHTKNDSWATIEGSFEVRK